jgi:Major intrinsic protein
MSSAGAGAGVGFHDRRPNEIDSTRRPSAPPLRRTVDYFSEPDQTGCGEDLRQIAGACVGVLAAHVMFGERLFMLSLHARSGPPQMFSEFVATFGLLSVIWGCSRRRSTTVPFAVAAYITAAYWFTASTSFANPAVTIARSLTDTFAGIRPADAPGFIAAQFLGAAAATLLFRWLVPALPDTADQVIVPHDQARIAVRETPERSPS